MDDVSMILLICISHFSQHTRFKICNFWIIDTGKLVVFVFFFFIYLCKNYENVISNYAFLILHFFLFDWFKIFEVVIFGLYFIVAINKHECWERLVNIIWQMEFFYQTNIQNVTVLITFVIK